MQFFVWLATARKRNVDKRTVLGAVAPLSCAGTVQYQVVESITLPGHLHLGVLGMNLAAAAGIEREKVKFVNW